MFTVEDKYKQRKMDSHIQDCCYMHTEIAQRGIIGTTVKTQHEERF